MKQFNQQINDNLEQVFNMADSRDNNQTQPETEKPKPRYSKKAPTRGGKREGGGRKPGSTNKISGTSIIAALEKMTGKTYEEQLAENYAVCIASDDRMMIAKYDQMFLNKVVGDKHDIDHTTLGESLKANFNFQQKELPDWQSIPTSIKLK